MEGTTTEDKATKKKKKKVTTNLVALEQPVRQADLLLSLHSTVASLLFTRFARNLSLVSCCNDILRIICTLVCKVICMYSECFLKKKKHFSQNCP